MCIELFQAMKQYKNNISVHDMTAQVPFIRDTEHEKQQHDVSTNVRLILQNKLLNFK